MGDSLPDLDSVRIVPEVHVDAPEVIREVELDLHVSMLRHGASDGEPWTVDELWIDHSRKWRICKIDAGRGGLYVGKLGVRVRKDVDKFSVHAGSCRSPESRACPLRVCGLTAASGAHTCRGKMNVRK